MDTVKEHTTSNNFERHIRNMASMLAEGDSHFLIGGVITPSGVKPVTFTRNISDGMREDLAKATPPIVMRLVLDRLQDFQDYMGTTQ